MLARPDEWQQALDYASGCFYYYREATQVQPFRCELGMSIKNNSILLMGYCHFMDFGECYQVCSRAAT